jgi:hypothetical protein
VRFDGSREIEYIWRCVERVTPGSFELTTF